MSNSLTVGAEPTTGITMCPHCKKGFDAQIDSDQPLRLQGVKCPSCRLFVPARHVVVTPSEPALS